MNDDYILGWKDCRDYLGEDPKGTDDYKQGFADCCSAYYHSLKTGNGWNKVPEKPKLEPGHDYNEWYLTF